MCQGERVENLSRDFLFITGLRFFSSLDIFLVYVIGDRDSGQKSAVLRLGQVQLGTNQIAGSGRQEVSHDCGSAQQAGSDRVGGRFQGIDAQ